MAGLSLKNVTKRYSAEVCAVKDFNLEIQDKEFIILVGPSGCGKSTTLRMIAGLEEISDGEIKIENRTVNDIPPKDRDIAMVFQNYALYPHMTVEQNLAFSLKMRKVPKAEIAEKVRVAAKTLDIEKYLKRKPKALSGGQRQRVALGRAIVRDPKVFLFDEPLSNLDAKLRAQMRTEISKLHQRLQTTFIYVTHDQVEAMTMGTRIVVMKDGVMQQEASPMELYDHPVNLFVATFIGTPQMNVLRMNVKKESDEVVLFQGENRIVLRAGARAYEALIKYEKEEIFAGIRPEKLEIDESAGSENQLHAKVDVIEQMGSEAFLYLNSQAGNLTAKVSPHFSAEIGSEIRIGIAADDVLFFDTETEEAVGDQKQGGELL